MKRFAWIYNQRNSRIAQIPFIQEQFDEFLFSEDMDWELLNQYEAIYFYGISGANKVMMGKWTADRMPECLRKNGVTKPKFLWQMDYYQSEYYQAFQYRHVYEYVDCLLDCCYWEGFGLKIPHYYVTYPLRYKPEELVWYDFDEKENYAVALKRHYGQPTLMPEISNRIGVKLKVLGWKDDKYGVEKRYGRDYNEFLGRAKFALDYQTTGTTWSRFGAENSLVGTPIFGHPHYHSIRVANSDFALPWKEPITRAYPNPNILRAIKKLLSDKEYYAKCQEKAKANILRHNDPEVCSNRYKSVLRLVGIDVE